MTPLTILSLLAADHRQVDRLFIALDRTTARGVRRRRDLFATLDEVLSRHADFEERRVYPLLKDHPTSRGFAVEAVEEHAAVRRLLDELRVLPPDDGRWGGKLGVLAQIIRHHVQEEEGEAFPFLHQVVTADELERLAADYGTISDDGTGPGGLEVVRRREMLD